jgi:hypothetical protein
MSEFKFSCPNCQQNIQATSEYSGLEINCPACQTPLVVPAAPDAPATPVPSGARLSKAATSAPVQPSASAAAAASFYATKPTRKKKPKTGLIVGLSLGAVAVAAAIYFWPELMKKVSHENQVAAAAQAATNAPPPPPPELTTEEILQKVGETYKGLTDYAAKAQTTADIDMSAITPGKKPIHMTTTSSLQLGRTNNYRLEWDQNAAGTMVKGAAWCSGAGNFVGYGPSQPGKVKTRQQALAPTQYPFYLLGTSIVGLFFSDTNSFAEETNNFTKTNSPDLNAQEEYMLTGVANHRSILLWIKKSNFLISKIEVIMSGTIIEEEELQKLPSAERAQTKLLSKIKGDITETYSAVQINQHLLASSFDSPYQPTANPNGNRGRNRGNGGSIGGGAGSDRPGSRAGQLTQPTRRNRQPPPE